MPSAAPTADTPFLFRRLRPPPGSNSRGRRCLAVILLLTSTACARSADIEAMQVLNYAQCSDLAPGLTLVGYEDLARIRGGELVAPATDKSAGIDASVALVAVSRGAQSTPGYGFDLTAATRTGTTAELRLHWSEPPDDAVLAQVITHPCLVVALPRAGIERVVAVDQTGAPVGSLALP